MPAPEGASEGGNRAAGGAGCRGGLLFGYFLLVGAAIRRQEKVTRRKGEKGRFVQHSCMENKSVPFFGLQSKSIHFAIKICEHPLRFGLRAQQGMIVDLIIGGVCEFAC